MMLNLKGGVAKTTNCVAMAECLADEGLRVLALDADHQCMASELLLGQDRYITCEHRRKTLHDLLAAMLDDEFTEENIPPFIENQASNIGEGYPNLDVIPCSIRIDDFQTNMAKARRGYHTPEEFLRMFTARGHILQRYLNSHYDYTLVDCPPSIVLQVKQFMRIADGFIIPCVPDRLSVRGAFWLLDRIRRSGYKRIQPIGTLWSLYRAQNAMHGRIVKAAGRGKEPFDHLPKPFKTVIPNSTAIAESTDPNRQPASYTAKYTSKFAHLFRDLCKELRDRTE